MDTEMKALSNHIVNDIFKKYNIVYNRESKVIKINKNIDVKDFVRLKEILTILNLEVSDIRVGDVVL